MKRPPAKPLPRTARRSDVAAFRRCSRLLYSALLRAGKTPEQARDEAKAALRAVV